MALIISSMWERGALISVGVVLLVWWWFGVGTTHRRVLWRVLCGSAERGGGGALISDSVLTVV